MSGTVSLRVTDASAPALAPTQVIPVLTGTPTLDGFSPANGPAASLITLAALATYFGADIGGPIIIDDAIDTPSAFSATKLEAFVSTVSGASIMGYGTTRDFTVFNRAGTVVIGVTANTTGVTMAGALAITGALSGVTTLGVSTSATITSANAAALAVGLAGATNPAFVVDASTALQAAGLKVTGAIAAGTVAAAVISSGADANLTIDAKGTGTMGIGTVSTGVISVGNASTVSVNVVGAQIQVNAETVSIGETAGSFVTIGSVNAGSGSTLIRGSDLDDLNGVGVGIYTPPASEGDHIEIGSGDEARIYGEGGQIIGKADQAYPTTFAGTGFGAGVASVRFNGLTSGAAAGAGTISNAPVAGNPAFWLPVNIAGTVHYIPAWLGA